MESEEFPKGMAGGAFAKAGSLMKEEKNGMGRIKRWIPEILRVLADLQETMSRDNMKDPSVYFCRVKVL